MYGSKPRREIEKNPAIGDAIKSRLRSYRQAVAYPPNQTFIGNLRPEKLRDEPRPWYTKQMEDNVVTRLCKGPFGEIMEQESFYALLQQADVLQPALFRRTEENAGSDGLPMLVGNRQIGVFHGDERAEGRDDENLAAHHLLENLCSKASGTMAVKQLLLQADVDPLHIDFVISCGEEACGDRYQRGGGGMAKAVAEMCGCSNASGLDIKNFCAAPASALIVAASLIKAGVHKQVVVVGGGSLAKLGMKFQGFLEKKIPILDDCLASMAFLVTSDDGKSPVIRLDASGTGKVPVGASTSDEAVFRHYLLAPLKALGLQITDIDRFAVELQNPEIMEHAGSGDVARKNYRKIAAMAVMDGQLPKEEMAAWIDKVGMEGYAPTQGHIPSAVPYLGHAIEAIMQGEMHRVMFLARASLFLNRLTSLLDGVSFVLERNPKL